MQVLVIAVCCLFVLLGLCLIPYAGIQNDEAFFANVLYQPAPPDLFITMFDHPVALMISDHIGALKSLLYWPIFAVFPPSAVSVRLPMVLAGAVTVWVFFRLGLRTAGVRPALFATLLLASDPSFLLADTFDWGPVALERLLLVSFCLFAVRFADQNRALDLAAAFFLLGLALWNRADFLWALAGLTVAGGVVLRSEIRRSLNWRNTVLVSAAFILGALPLLLYNFHRPNETLGANARLEFDKFGVKFHQLNSTLAGSDLFGFLVADEWSDAHPKAPVSLPGRTALWVRNRLGEHRRDGMFWACTVALAAVPLWWSSKTARFSLAFIAITWGCMAVTRGAGEAAHHVLMLWPFPQLFLAIVLGALGWYWAADLVIVVLVTLNLLVVSQHFLQFERDGAASNFTDALFPLSQELVDAPGQTIYVADWGMMDTLVLLHKGQLNIHPIYDRFIKDTLSQPEQAEITQIFSDPATLYIGHVPGREAFPGVRERLNRAAIGHGYRKKIVDVISDSNGRPVFELFRLQASTEKLRARSTGSLWRQQLHPRDHSGTGVSCLVA